LHTVTPQKKAIFRNSRHKFLICEDALPPRWNTSLRFETVFEINVGILKNSPNFAQLLVQLLVLQLVLLAKVLFFVEDLWAQISN